MGFFKDLENEIESARFDIASEITGKEVQRPREQESPGIVKKLSAAFVSGIYATRNMQRAQWGMMHPNDMGMMRGFGPHHPGDGCEMGG